MKSTYEMGPQNEHRQGINARPVAVAEPSIIGMVIAGIILVLLAKRMSDIFRWKG